MNSRYHIAIRGAVQGVGFRPFVYRLAHTLGVKGWILNNGQGVFLDAEGDQTTLDEFILRIDSEKPAHAVIQSFEYSVLDCAGYDRFEIRASDALGETSALVVPDIATCPDCRDEIFNPSDRRYRYPFTNCTNCGPRYSIIEELPYDRVNTTMRGFVMCLECSREYHDPSNRRFHAQPIACPDCGPHLALWDGKGNILAQRDDALREGAAIILRGGILAMKGLGGFQLLADARNQETVELLRYRKHREDKPLAVMFPSMTHLQKVCAVSPLEDRLLRSAEAPIVLLRRTRGETNPPVDISAAVAPRNPSLGAMLPYTPLHHLLLHELNIPVIATSGNLSDEPICIDEKEALERLNTIADYFLVHDRPIKRHVDDSVVRVILGREYVLRRARGYAPLPVTVNDQGSKAVCAVGAHLKNSVALQIHDNVIISQHIGDLESRESFEAFQHVTEDLQRMYRFNPHTIVCDLHPDYLSTRYAETSGHAIEKVQHHYAHVASCMAENHIDGPLLGVAWDGTGYGTDGTVWGGEFLVTTSRSFERVATFRNFLLPGGDRAIREPRRTAMGMLYEIFGDTYRHHSSVATVDSFTLGELDLMERMLAKKINSPRTSSVGRLFDGVASMTGIRHVSRFEGQAAMELEYAVGDLRTDAAYDHAVQPSGGGPGPQTIDWEPCVRGVMGDIARGVSTTVIAAKFHNMLVNAILDIAHRTGLEKVVLSGGCFQNCLLLENTVNRLRHDGFHAYWHQRVPPNDGGISLGQIYAVARLRKNPLPCVPADEISREAR